MGDYNFQSASTGAVPNITTTTEHGGSQYTYESGDIAWTLTSSTLIWLMAPGL